NRNRRRDNQVLREHRGSRCGDVAGNNGKVECARFFQAAGGRGKAKSARQRSFREGVFHFSEFPVMLWICLSTCAPGLQLLSKVAFRRACGVSRFSLGEIRRWDFASRSSRNLRSASIGRRGGFSVGPPEGTSDPPRLARMIAG